ncbi:MAG: DUF4965 domain-containing protein [Acidobacteriia bacterium]|nr:DUF4965 domain-containing protein [Terriglobia bacterium]
MKESFLTCILFIFACIGSAQVQTSAPFRPPAVPLVAHDPYFSIWSPYNLLTEGPTTHWTGTAQSMSGMVSIDGRPFQIMGAAGRGNPVMKQTEMEVLPTRTIYQFDAEGVHITLTFMTPALPDDLEILSRPVTYLIWNVRSTDSRNHKVSLYFHCAVQLAVNMPDQQVVWSRAKVGDLDVLRAGSREQPVLAKSGDNLRIDWGYLYVAGARQEVSSSAITSDRAARTEFMKSSSLPGSDDLDMPRAAGDRTPVLAFTFNLGEVGANPVSRHLMVAYDDLYSIEYFNRRLRPYWRRNGMDAAALLQAAHQDYAGLTERCRKLDAQLAADLRQAGGEEYARIASLAYRQTVAAHKLVADIDGTPLLFSKENFSNGCIDTVDVTYPSSPFFLVFNPQLLKGQLIPILEYASLPRWRFPFAPHDLGTYPLANGQVYGGREQSEDNQMPVEESGNMLLMITALAKKDGNANFAIKYWPVLAKWATYLREKGLDPENQLCTDDFAGHLAHNTNLSLKAILALGGYATLCDMAGRKDEAVAFRKTAEDMAARWQQMASDGDHYRLTFDRADTWSQKYNLVWDRLLGLNLFPAEVARREISYYKTRLNKFGLPLDLRKDYTKLDWELWTATLADNPMDFAALVGPIYRWVIESPDRVPLTDWYATSDGKKQGFQARSVVGGIFIKLLAEKTR